MRDYTGNARGRSEYLDQANRAAIQRGDLDFIRQDGSFASNVKRPSNPSTDLEKQANIEADRALAAINRDPAQALFDLMNAMNEARNCEINPDFYLP